MFVKAFGNNRAHLSCGCQSHSAYENMTEVVAKTHRTIYGQAQFGLNEVTWGTQFIRTLL